MTCMTTIYNNRETAHTHTHDSDIYAKVIPGLDDSTGPSTGHVVELITREIVEIHHSIKDFVDQKIYHDPSGHLKAVFQRLDYLIALDIDNKSTEDILSNSVFNSAFDAISTFRSQYTAELEIEQANSVLKSEDPWKTLTDFTYLPNYIQLARTESRGAGLKPGDTVLFLGSGPLPLTLIVLCHQHGLNGIGIEQNPERVELSRRTLEKLGLSSQIRIIRGNQQTLPLAETPELIMIAAQAEPKKEIFDHLAGVLPAGAKISYRIYEKGLRRMLDTFYRYELPGPLREYVRIPPEPPANNTSVFLTVVD
ncbi:MAG: nicotianamine synthase family protein [Euryarchaeota archaeon]|nr:nicotianamine synthase family protein [Euryarchaeota archaeon]